VLHFAFLAQDTKTPRYKVNRTGLRGRYILKICVYVLFADETPKLQDLYRFEHSHGEKKTALRIIEEIGDDYFQFGVCLLDDSGGNRVRGIEIFRQSHPDTIISDILQDWLKGKGRRPETWSTLLECLRNTRLHALADNLEYVLDGTLEFENVLDGTQENQTIPNHKGNM